jgi:ribosomal protein S6
MQKEKYYYELAYLVKPDLNEAELKGLNDKIEALCSKEKIILKSEMARRIRLAYPIKKQREAFLVSINFQAEPETVVGIKKELDDFNQIIRLLIIKKRIVPEEPIKLTPALEIQTPPESKNTVEGANQPQLREIADTKEKPKKEKKAKELSKKKVSMEDIEKDLDKILGE